jgi:hypothetical protein
VEVEGAFFNPINLVNLVNSINQTDSSRLEKEKKTMWINFITLQGGKNEYR